MGKSTSSLRRCHGPSRHAAALENTVFQCFLNYLWPMITIHPIPPHPIQTVHPQSLFNHLNRPWIDLSGLPMTTHDYQWLPMTIQWLSDDYLWLPMTTNDYQLLPMTTKTTNNCQSLPITVEKTIEKTIKKTIKKTIEKTIEETIKKTLWWLSDDYLITRRWLSDDYPMTIQWLSDDYLMTIRWPSVDYLMTIWWISDDYPMTIRWLSNDYIMNIQWLSNDYPMTITNFWSIFLDDYWYKKIYRLKMIV